jgi:hypothetical protein
VSSFGPKEEREDQIMLDLGSASGSSVKWQLNIGLWLAILIAASIFHPPPLIILILNMLLLFVNINAAQKAGTQNVPQWLYVLIAAQGVVCVQAAVQCFL